MPVSLLNNTKFYICPWIKLLKLQENIILSCVIEKTGLIAKSYNRYKFK